MKKVISIAIINVLFIISINAQQNLDDFGKIILKPFVSNDLNNEAKNILENKLKQITLKAGIVSTNYNSQFIITGSVNVVSKDIISGPPQMIANNLNLVLYIGDAINKNQYSTISISLKGVGTNETKAMIDALNNINTNNQEIKNFIDNGKNKILTYYSTQCNNIINEANTLAKIQKFDEALYKLSLIPNLNDDCFNNTLKAKEIIFQQLIDYKGKTLLNDAKLKWNSTQNLNGANEVSLILGSINPLSSSYKESTLLIEIISKKVNEIEKKEWDFKLKQYTDNVEIEKMKIKSYKEISLEYIKNQPQTIIYSDLNWR